MKKKDTQNFQEKTIQQLSSQVSKDKHKLGEELADFYGKKGKNPKKLRKLKKSIAQALTILRQKEIEGKSNDKNNNTKMKGAK